MRIEDCAGAGFAAQVNADKQLRVFSTIEAVDRRQNRDGRAWSLPFDGIDPAGADDYFFYLKNTGTQLMAITDVRIDSTVAGTVEVHYVSGTPSYTSDTDVSPVGRLLGGSRVPAITCKTDTDTTGLTNEGVLFYIPCPTANQMEHLRISSNIFLPPGTSMAMLWDTSTGILQGVVSLVEVDADRE